MREVAFTRGRRDVAAGWPRKPLQVIWLFSHPLHFIVSRISTFNSDLVPNRTEFSIQSRHHKNVPEQGLSETMAEIIWYLVAFVRYWTDKASNTKNYYRMNSIIINHNRIWTENARNRNTRRVSYSVSTQSRVWLS